MKFKRVIDETTPQALVESNKIKKVIFCSGQVYYDLFERRKERNYNVIVTLLTN